MTGVRWAESNSRKTRAVIEVQHNRHKGKRLNLNADNDESRRLFETCQLKGKRVLNPIIDWTDAEVWEFLKHYNCASNPLYRRGRDRVGCIGCPMAGQKARLRDFNDYPKYQENYIRAFNRMVAQGIESSNPNRAWRTGQEVFDWWMADVNLDRQIDGQIEWEL